jgi:hypothetical protein
MISALRQAGQIVLVIRMIYEGSSEILAAPELNWARRGSIGRRR